MTETSHLTPDTPEFEINRQNRHSINSLRSTLVYLSDTVRKDVARWCVQAENKPDFPWEDLFSIVRNSDADLKILMKASTQFREYAERHLNGRIKEIDMTPISLENASTEDNQTSVYEENLVQTQTEAVQSSVTAKIAHVKRTSGVRSIYQPPKTHASGGEK